MVEYVADAAPPMCIWQALTVDKAARAALKGQKPVAMWFTGLSGAGKIHHRQSGRAAACTPLGRHTFILDGDNVRHGLNRDLGFSEADRVENIRRAAEAAQADGGCRADRAGRPSSRPTAPTAQAARELFEPGEFIEVFVDTPIEECRRRDPKGLYRRARPGTIRNFTGIDAPYEAPDDAEIHLRTMDAPPEQQVEMLIRALKTEGIIP